MAGKVVVLIDDEFKKIKELGEMLESDGYSVSTATSKEDALELTVELMPAVIVIKAILIDASEFDIIRTLRSIEAVKGIPIIMVTESEEDFNDISVISKYKPDYGIADVLQMPIDRDEFIEKIRGVSMRIEAGDNVVDNTTTVYEEPQPQPEPEQGFKGIVAEAAEGKPAGAEGLKGDFTREEEAADGYDYGDYQGHRGLKEIIIEKVSGVMNTPKLLFTAAGAGVVAIALISAFIFKSHEGGKDKVLAGKDGEVITIVEPPGAATFDTANNKEAASGKDAGKITDKDKAGAIENEGLATIEDVAPSTQTTPAEKKPAAGKPAPEERSQPAKAEKIQKTVKEEPKDKKEAPKKTVKEEPKKTVKEEAKKTTKETEKHKTQSVAEKSTGKEELSPMGVHVAVKPGHEAAKPVEHEKVKEKAPTKTEAVKKVAESKKTDVTKQALAKEQAAHTPSKGTYTIQVGVFESKKKAMKLVETLKADKFEAYYREINLDGGPAFKVLVGKFTERKEAVSVNSRLKSSHKMDSIIYKN